MRNKGRIVVSYYPWGLILLTITAAIFLLQFLPTFDHVENGYLVPIYFNLMGLLSLCIALTFCKAYVLENGIVFHQIFGICYRKTVLDNSIELLRVYSGDKYQASYSCLLVSNPSSADQAVKKALSQCQKLTPPAKVSPYALCSTRSTFFLHWLIGDIFSIQYQDTETVSQIFDYCSSYCTVIYDILNQS